MSRIKGFRLKGLTLKAIGLPNISMRDKKLRRNSLTHAVGRSYSTILTFPPLLDENKVCEYALQLQVTIQYIRNT
jgi:hypothetical protein